MWTDHTLTRCTRRLVLWAIVTLSACGTESGTGPPPQEVADTLAFTMDSSIYVMGVEAGAVPVRLDSGFINPSWSPDGSTLAMVATGPPNPVTLDLAQALYLADADGGNVRQLAGFIREITGPVLWSPDGTSLIFVRYQHGFGPDYQYLVRVPISGAETPFGLFGLDVSGSWSRDGSLAAASNGDTIDVVAVATNQIEHQISGGLPQFSPVSDEIAFRDESGGIHVIRPDGTANRGLGVAGFPLSWSPNGRRIAFSGVDSMYIIGADGSGLLRIGPLDMRIGDIAWSPDGSRIAYVAAPVSGPQTLYVASADDSDRRPIVTTDKLCCPAWKPPRP